MDLAEVPIDARCSECKRALAVDAAFTVDDRLYCGSCAPPGAVPARIELSEQAGGTSGPVPAGRPPVVATLRQFVGELLGRKK